MRTPLLVAATSCLALSIGSAALAQQDTRPTTPPSSPGAPPATAPRAPTASTLPAAGPVDSIGTATIVGTNVKNSAGETIGEIKDVVMDSSGKATNVILGTGGVLGLGSRNVPVGWDQIKMSRDDGGKLVATTSLTKEQIEGMPEYTKDNGAWRPK